MSFNLEEYFEEFYEKLKHIIKTKAPILHSSKTTEYGKGTDSEYGHVKVEKSLVNTENPVESSVIKNNIDGINTRIDGMTIDTELNNQSKKPVENRVITNKINSLDGTTLKLNGLTDQTLEDAINVRIPGKDGKGLEFVFKRMSIMINDWDDEEELPAQTINPAKLDAVQEDDYVPDGWTDDQEEVTWEIPYQYVSTRTKEVISKEDGGDDYTGIWNKFTTPKLWSVYGEKPFCHLRYADIPEPTNWNDTFPQPQTDTTSGGMNYHKYEGYLWNEEQVLSDENKDPTLFTWRIYRPTIGVAGKEGSFLHIAYAMNEAGDGFNQYEGDYIGTCVTWEEEDPDDPDLYNWVRIKGNAGIDTEFVYYTTNVENFTGKPTNIKNQPELKRWCERPYPVSEANPYCYISVKDVKDSTWSNAVLWAKYGEQGEIGPEGERGEDGIGLEMIFRRNSNTTNAPGFVNGQNNSNFQGTVTRKVNGVNKAFYYQDDDYVPEYWTDDQQGVTAKSGEQVEWVCMRFKKIGDDGKIAEWGDFNEPKVWATYSKDGKGVISIVEKYYLHTSYQSLPSGLKDSDWLATAPTVTEGKYLWAKSFITYTDNTVDTTDPVCITGRDGDGVHYIYYCYNSTNKPNPPTKWSDIHGNTNTSADYGRWVEDPVSVTESNQYLYMSESTTHSYDSNGNKIWVDFKPSVLWSTYSEDAISVMLGNEAQLIAVDGNGSLKSNPTTITIPVYCYKGTNKIAGTINLSSISNTFSAKTVTREPTTTNDGGLITLQCTSVPTQITKNEPIIVTVDGVVITKYFTWHKIGDGSDGNEGGTYDFVYWTKSNDTPPSKPANKNASINPNTNGDVYDAWCARPSTQSASKPYCFGSYIKKVNGVAIGNYSDVFLWSKYAIDGTRGTGAVNVTTAPSTYTTTTGGFTPSYRISLSTAKTQSKLSEILVGDYVRYSYYVYPVGYVDSSYVYLGNAISIRGASGRAVASVENQYASSTSKTTAPSSGWNTNITQPTFNSTYKYLWNKEVSRDSDNNVISESTPVIIAEYSSNGGISGVTEQYALTDKTTAPSNDKWGTNIPQMSSTDKYLWNREIITYVNKVQYTSPSKIIGVYGDRGLTGEDGADGEGLEMIFKRTTTDSAPKFVTDSYGNQGLSNYSGTINGRKFKDPDFLPSGWTDDQTGVNENNQYEWVSMRTKIPDTVTDPSGKTLKWDSFNSPSLWAKWGERGEDGISPTTDDVLTEVIKEIDPENLDAKSLGGLTADGYIEKEPEFQLLTQTNNTYGRIECRKLGFLIIINVLNWVVKKCTTEGWQWLRKDANDTATTHTYTQDIYIPEGYRPANDLLIGSANTSGSNFNDMVLRLDNDGRLRTKTNAMASQENMNGTFVFFVDSRTATVLTDNTASTLYCGDSLEATLTNSSSGNVLAGKTLTFSINDKHYPRVTESNGKAKLSLNLPPGKYNYSVSFGGDNSYKPATSIIVANKTLNKVPSNQVKLSSTTPSTVYRTTPFTGYLKNNIDNPISGVTVTVQIGSRTFTGKTNTSGYYKIYHPNDNIAYNNMNHDITISVSDNTKTGAKSIPISAIFKP